MSLAEHSPRSIDTAYDSDATIRSVVDDAHQSRLDYMQDVSKLAPFLPQLSDDLAKEIHEQIDTNERKLSPRLVKSEYGDGSAHYDDEIWSGGNEDSKIIISADHATDPVRKATGIREGADHGTGGLAMTVAAQAGAEFVLPAGRQTGNANVDMAHPMKDELLKRLPGKGSFVSLHGMMPGKFSHQLDRSEIHGVIGLGTDPEERSIQVAHRLIAQAFDKYGLRVVVGNDTRFFAPNDSSPRLEYEDDGTPKYSARLAALGPGSTTNFVRAVVDRPALPAMQLEISRTLRLLPREMEYRKPREIVLSVYMGYLLANELVELAADYA